MAYLLQMVNMTNKPKDPPTKSEIKPDDLLFKYAESWARLVQQANRTWIALAVLSVYCLLVGPAEKGGVKLLGLEMPSLPRYQFATVAACLLVALLIHWQEILNRIQFVRKDRVQQRIEELETAGYTDAEKVWDAVATPSTQAVWFIASSLVLLY